MDGGRGWPSLGHLTGPCVRARGARRDPTSPPGSTPRGSEAHDRRPARRCDSEFERAPAATGCATRSPCPSSARRRALRREFPRLTTIAKREPTGVALTRRQPANFPADVTDAHDDSPAATGTAPTWTHSTTAHPQLSRVSRSATGSATTRPRAHPGVVHPSPAGHADGSSSRNRASSAATSSDSDTGSTRPFSAFGIPGRQHALSSRRARRNRGTLGIA